MSACAARRHVLIALLDADHVGHEAATSWFAAILQRLGVAKATEHHRFWPDDVSLADVEVFTHGELLGPKQITDRYLLALAVRNNGRLVTFDQGVRPTAVIGAAAEHLVRLPG